MADGGRDAAEALQDYIFEPPTDIAARFTARGTGKQRLPRLLQAGRAGAVDRARWQMHRELDTRAGQDIMWASGATEAWLP